MGLFSFFGFGKKPAVVPGDSEAELKEQVAGLQKQLEQLRVENTRLRKEPDGEQSEKETSEKASRRRSSQAKLETLDESGDEQTARYIKSHFVSTETLEENSFSSKGSAPLDVLRRDAKTVIAANRMQKAPLERMKKNGEGGSPSGSLPRLKSSHKCMTIVPSRHLRPNATDAELDEVLAIKAQIEESLWEADTLRLCALLRMPMTYIVTLVLQQWDTKELHIDETTFVTLFENLERGYLFTNPYHNATHAADVAYSTHVMLKHGAQEALQVSDLQCAVCVIAAAAHDFRHPGIGADFLIKTGHELALTYNDKSPLENFHVSEFFKMMQQKPEINFLQQLDNKAQQEFRKAMIAMILATDMTVHFDYLDRFTKRFASPDAELAKKPFTEEEQNFGLAMLLHCADISNPAKPKNTYFDWTDRVLAEFYYQGIKQSSHGLPIDPFFCDRANPAVAKAQTGFIGFVVKPLFEKWCEFVPQLKPMTMPYIESNLAIWKTEEPLIPPSQAFTSADKSDWDWESGCWKQR